LPKCKTINHILPKNSSKYFDYPIQQIWHRSFPYQDHGEEVEEKTRVEGKTRRKRRPGVKRRRLREESPRQGDESVRPHDLEIIHPTPQNKPKLFLLSV
jgi:hypothetical protein